MGRHHIYIFGLFTQVHRIAGLGVMLGQRTRAVTTPPPHSHCQSNVWLLRKGWGSLGQWSLPSWRERVKAVPYEGLGRVWDFTLITHLIDASRRHEIAGSETNNFMTEGSTCSIITWVPLPSNPPGDDAEGHRWSLHHSWGTPCLGNPPCLMRELWQDY